MSQCTPVTARGQHSHWLLKLDLHGSFKMMVFLELKVTADGVNFIYLKILSCQSRTACCVILNVFLANNFLRHTCFHRNSEFMECDGFGVLVKVLGGMGFV